MNDSVCCVLVNFRAGADTVACVKSLLDLERRPERIVVVDNGSGDDSLSVLRAGLGNRDGVEILENASNSGFAGGCNWGMAHATSTGFMGWFWLLNNDTLAEPHALQEMLLEAERSQADLVGSLIVDFHDPAKVIGGVWQMSPWTAAVRPVRGAAVLGPLQYIEGSSLLISPACYAKLGGLPEEYFLYFEESDYCFRARRAGFRLVHAAKSIIRHQVGRTTGSGKLPGEVPLFADCLMIRNRLVFGRSCQIPALTLWCGWLYSLLLRLWRGQWSRVKIIIRISCSPKAFWTFVALHRG